MQADLNPAQRKAVNTLSGPLLVLAGAGTGKTRVVTFRIANLIRHGVEPGRILAVTFTNKAANEMQQRVAVLLGKRLKTRPVVSTFHAYCVQILRRHIRRLGYPQRFAIYDRADQESLARQVLRELRVPGQQLRPGDLIAAIGRWKSRSILPEQALETVTDDRQHLAAAAYGRYQQALKAAGAVDFDDLLLCTVQLLTGHADVRDEEAARFDHLLIDEYQDTNASQYRIVKALARRHRNLCVVGDDDQSIYGWRGAEVQHILGFVRDWPDATVVRLEQNYRSTAEILQLANRLIRFNSARHEKRLRAVRHGGERPRILQFPDETVEAKAVVAEIRQLIHRGRLQPRHFAILFRTNEQPRGFETELRRVGLPYVLVGGMSFFDRKEVRDILAYLRTIASPGDEVSLLRIINRPPRGIGQKTVAQLMQQAVERGCSLWEVLQSPRGLSAAATEAVGRFTALIQQFRRRADSGDLVHLARDLIERIDYRAELSRMYPEPQEQQARWDAVEEVINALGNYQAGAERPGLQGFLDEATLASRDFDQQQEKELARNAICLMTLHSAKGLEFPHVYMVGMEEGILPHRRSLADGERAVDEERRLCYVGVTRAQDRLTLTFPLQRMKWGKPRKSVPSRFLFELAGKAEQRRPASRAS